MDSVSKSLNKYTKILVARDMHAYNPSIWELKAGGGKFKDLKEYTDHQVWKPQTLRLHDRPEF